MASVYDSKSLFGGRARFLDTKSKRKELAFLRKEISNKRVDRQMLPYLKRINSIKGVCTQFCCMGHPRLDGFPGHNLIFFVDEYAHKAMLNNWFTIARWPECVLLETNLHYLDGMIRWVIDWKVTKHRTYYREFLDKFVPGLRKWRREIKVL